jgi:prepilin-type N-terminal cleavage/methylation domain-containing protein
MKKGYTLIELMVSLGIMALILLSIYKTFSVGWISYDRAMKVCQANQSARNTIKFLTRDLRSIGSAEPLYIGRDSVTTAAMIKRPYFKITGGVDNMDFFTYSRPVTLYWPESFPRRSYRSHVTYFLGATNDPNIPQCYYRQVKWDFSTPPWKDEEVEMLDGITDIQFSYYDWQKKKWVDTWDTDLILKQKGYNFHGMYPQTVNFRVTAQSIGVNSVVAVLESSVNVVSYER